MSFVEQKCMIPNLSVLTSGLVLQPVNDSFSQRCRSSFGDHVRVRIQACKVQPCGQLLIEERTILQGIIWQVMNMIQNVFDMSYNAKK